MDTKVIAMVGAVIVVGAAVYGVATGTVLPGSDDITGDEPANQGENTSGNTVPAPPPDTGDTDGSGSGSSGGGSKTGTSGNAVGNTTNEVMDTGPEPLPVVCEKRSANITRDDLETVHSAAGQPLDPLLAESMLHRKLNKLRALRSDAEPLKCDPKLRKIARQHSKLVLIQEGFMGGDFITTDYKESRRRIRSLGGDLTIQENIAEIKADDITINETAKRYEGVCDNPKETTGRFVYRKNIKGGSSGGFSFSGADFGSDQTLTIIKSHDELTRDVRRLFVDNLDTITNPKMERQGIGVATDRKTGATVVTHVICGPRSQAQDSDQK